MKRGSYLAAFLIIGTLFACNNPRNEDSVSLAKDANKDDSVSHMDPATMGNSDVIASGQNNNDSDFAVAAADGGMLEVQLGEVAVKKATDAGVKKFAQMMVEDHTKANNELKALAEQKGITLPPTLSRDNMDLMNKLNDKQGNDFDKDYIDHMVTDHKGDISRFEDAAKNAEDADIRNFASKTLPVLKKHLNAAEALKDRL